MHHLEIRPATCIKDHAKSMGYIALCRGTFKGGVVHNKQKFTLF